MLRVYNINTKLNSTEENKVIIKRANKCWFTVQRSLYIKWTPH